MYRGSLSSRRLPRLLVARLDGASSSIKVTAFVFTYIDYHYLQILGTMRSRAINTNFTRVIRTACTSQAEPTRGSRYTQSGLSTTRISQVSEFARQK